MVTPTMSDSTNEREIVDFLLEKARKIDELTTFLVKLSCDIALGKVPWNNSTGNMIVKEFQDLRGELIRSEVAVIDLSTPKGGE